MPIGKLTTEVDEADGFSLASEILANVANGTAKVAVANIPELAKRRIDVASDSTVLLSQAEHYGRLINVDNGSGPVVFNLDASTAALVDEVDNEGVTIARGGLFCTFIIASPANSVSFAALSSGLLRATGLAFQGGANTADTVYVGANLAASDEAVVRLYKRSSFWILECSQGWRTSELGDDLLVGASQLEKSATITSVQDYEITDSDHQKPIWLKNATPGTLTFASELTQGMHTSIVNGGGATATFDFAGHTQIGAVNSIPAGGAGSLIVGETTSGTNREIILKSSS